MRQPRCSKARRATVHVFCTSRRSGAADGCGQRCICGRSTLARIIAVRLRCGEADSAHSGARYPQTRDLFRRHINDHGKFGPGSTECTAFKSPRQGRRWDVLAICANRIAVNLDTAQLCGKGVADFERQLATRAARDCRVPLDRDSAIVGADRGKAPITQLEICRWIDGLVYRLQPIHSIREICQAGLSDVSARQCGASTATSQRT